MSEEKRDGEEGGVGDQCNCDSFDLNDFIDFYLPFYLLILLFIFHSFQKIIKQRDQKNEQIIQIYKYHNTSTPSTPTSSSNILNSNDPSLTSTDNSSRTTTSSSSSTTVSSISNVPNEKWKESMNGYWNVCWADDLDKWLKFLKKPFVRSMAQTMFFQINQIIQFINKEEEGKNNITYLKFERERGGKLENWILYIKVGKTESESEEVIQGDHEDNLTSYRAWINEQRKELIIQGTPIEKGKNNLKLLVTRKLIDENTLLMVKYSASFRHSFISSFIIINLLS